MAGQMKQQLETFDGTSNRSAYAPSESLVGKGERAWLQQITDLNRIQVSPPHRGCYTCVFTA